MREIKFRAWDKKKKRMSRFVDLREIIKIDRDDLLFETNIDDLKFMQYTGSKDKNGKGKEVYQSDLIRSRPNGYEPREVYEVVWNEDKYEWGIKNKASQITPLWSFDKDFEVIGNIYENKNLIKN
jgi:uncharacterized phage protein (TIGR01671 family)